MHWGPGRSLVAFVKTLRTLGGGCCSSGGAGDGMFNTLRNGVGPPPSELGNDGDFYIDTDADTIYGPRGGIGGVSPGDWGPPTSMIGPPGADGADATAVLENIGDGEDIYAGAVSGVSRIRGIKGTGVATATVVGSNVEINVPAAEAGVVEGSNIGTGEQIYAGLAVDGKLEHRTLTGTGLAQVTTIGDEVNVHVEPVDVEGITIDGPVGGMTLKTGAQSLNAVIGGEGQIPRVASGTIAFENPVEVPEGDVDDVVGLDGLGGLKNLGPMPSGGGEGGGGTSNVVLGGATGQILYKAGTDSIGGTSWTYAASAFIAGAVGYIRAGLGNLASKAFLRLANNYGAIIAQRSQFNTEDHVLLASSTDKGYLFSNVGLSDQTPDGYIYAALTVLIGIGRNTFLRFINSYIEQCAPIIGGGGKPYGLNGEYTFAPGTQAASVTALSKYIWHFPPGGVEVAEYYLTVPLPTNYVEGYTKFIDLSVSATLRVSNGVSYVDIAGPKRGVVAVGVSSVVFGGS